MKILAIESSCDETSVAIVEDGRYVLTNLVSSQVNLHAKYGGVVPELASRMHAEKINFLIDKALFEANLEYKNLDAIAVTYGPGLEGALLIGVTAGKTMAKLLNIPLIPVNHLAGHIYANFLETKGPKFPFLAVIISGGHTQLVLVRDHMDFELLGATRDDAVGEVFDKVARFLGLGYPGGPIIEKLARKGKSDKYRFPRAMINQGLEFSFSGLKTAVIQKIMQMKKDKESFMIEDICASFQQAVIDILIIKTKKACQKYNLTRVVLSGGVSANNAIRTTFETELNQDKIVCYKPDNKYCTDNAGMIASVAFYQYQLNNLQNLEISVKPNLKLCN